ncbi:MAG TPA: basic secretory protein-like protein [Pirellulaceae bacterium]|nr:basic secretory protein-like protein [Pirellulaceae bacterium]
MSLTRSCLIVALLLGADSLLFGQETPPEPTPPADLPAEENPVETTEAEADEAEKLIDVIEFGEGFVARVDTTEVPDLRPWVNERLKPVIVEWYPKLVEMLPSDDFQAPREFTIVFRKDMDGVAYASGNSITCAGPWYRRNLDGEALGSIVHEMVHVVQQYRGGRRRNRNPGWMVEGLADYLRWFLYEPEANRPRVDPRRSNFDDSYRTSAAFLAYAVETYDRELIRKFNAAMREGRYSDDLWKEFTGKEPAEIWSEYVATLKQ